MLPLLILCDRPRHIIHAAAGYRIGSIDTALSFCRGWQKESPHRPRAQWRQAKHARTKNKE